MPYIRLKEIGSPDAVDEPSICSIYITSCTSKDQTAKVSPVRADQLEKHLANILVGKVRIQETSCGLIVEFTREEDVNQVLNMQMTKIFNQAVIVWKFPVGLRRYKKVVTVKDIPWCVPLLEVQNALKFQGKSHSNLFRF